MAKKLDDGTAAPHAGRRPSIAIDDAPLVSLKDLRKRARQTQEDLAFQRRSEPEDEWVKFLEGRLQAFKLVQGFVEDLQSRRVRLH